MAEEQHAKDVNALKICFHSFSNDHDAISVELHKRNTCEELIDIALKKMGLESRESSTGSSDGDAAAASAEHSSSELKRNKRRSAGRLLRNDYELCEVMGTLDGQTCKERRLDANEYPVAVQLLWPKTLPMDGECSNLAEYRFVLREKRRAGQATFSIQNTQGSSIDAFLAKFLQQPKDKEYPDLCLLPELTEATLLENLKERFLSGHVYTYIGPILVSVNPFKFYPIYNPKYVKLYQNRSLGSLPPHIFAIADSAYHTMLRKKQNQCIVISGESGSGKTESTSFLLHHLTALSQKGSTASGVEQILLCAGPVMEAFGNSVTAQNNNSSRFGKFIQVNYRENGIVCGGSVQIYLLEKSRIISQAEGERNYHVFYYMLAGATEEERKALNLLTPQQYAYLNKNQFYEVDGLDDRYEFGRLRQSMELVGFGSEEQRRIFGVLSAILLLGNIEYSKRSISHLDDTAFIVNEDVLSVIADLLSVKTEKLSLSLTTKRTVARNETVIARYRVPEASWARDAMTKCLYNALFDWIVLKINQALLRRDSDGVLKGHYIGILDIFGFENIGAQLNSFEQFCINYANERLQLYFNQHIFQFEQEEYQHQGITWTNIEFVDNTDCLKLMHSKPYGIFHLLDEECSISSASDDTLLEKVNKYQKENEYFEVPQKRERAFIIAHYAGKVKYQVKGFREKNKDMRIDVCNTLKNSKSSFVRELIGNDPLAVFRWAVLRATFRAVFAFKESANSGRNKVKQKENAEDCHDVDQSIARHSSESQLQALLRGEIDEKLVMPSFCDLSVLDSIREHVLKENCMCNEHVGKITKYSVSSRCSDRNSFVLSRKNRFEDKIGSPQERPRPPPKHAQNILLLPRQMFGYLDSDILSEIELIVKRSSLVRPSDSVQKGSRGITTLKALSIGGRRRHGRKQPTTVGAQFQTSLKILMETLSQANPFFIRCVRSNNDKIPCHFDEDIILQQLRYTGMLETVRIRRAGYSVRLLYEEFVQQYRILLPNGTDSGKQDVLDFIFNHPLVDRHNFQFGYDKIFIRDAEKLLLDDQLHRCILAHIQRQQSWVRTFLLRRRFLLARRSAVKIQAFVRGWLVRQKFRRQELACLCIQSFWLGYLERRRFLKLRQTVVFLQSGIRGFLVRKLFHEQRSAGCYKWTVSAQTWDGAGLSSPLSGNSEDLDQCDEGILTKGSNDDVFCSSPRGGVLQLRQDSDDESSGIDGDWETESRKWNRERQMSLDACFVLDDGARMKLVSSHDVVRRPSLTPSTSSQAQIRALRKTASSHDLSRSVSVSSLKMQGAFLPGCSTAASTSKTNKKPSGLLRATKQIRAMITGRTLGLDASVEYSQDLKNSTIGANNVTLPLSFQHTQKLVFFRRSESCAVCRRNISSFTAQYNCVVCKLAFHRECWPLCKTTPCLPARVSSHKNSAGLTARDPQSPRHEPESPGGWFLNKTMEFKDPADIIIASYEDLKFFSKFIFQKIISLTLKSQSQRDTVVDAIFKKALKELHTELLSHQATVKVETISMKYGDLIQTFEWCLNKCCMQEQTTSDAFPLTVGLNAFRGFLNEFLISKKKEAALLKNRAKSLRKKRRSSNVITHMGHRFKPDMVHVPTYCEVCNKFMWHAEKIYICEGCRLSCHKKCHNRVLQSCTTTSKECPIVGAGRFFGGELSLLVDDEQLVPHILQDLFAAVELRGLWSEGIYRKSGSLAVIKQQRRRIENASDDEVLQFDETPVYVLTTLIKSFFRELPEPLLTFDLYENFISVADVLDETERLRCLYSMIELLPKINRYILDRLLFHLARVAHQQDINKMSSQNLAVIFAPALMKSEGTNVVKAQEQLDNVHRQMICVQTLIDAKLKQFRSTISEIVKLENVSEKVSSNLMKIDKHYCDNSDSVKEIQQAKQLFMEQLEFLDIERDKLIDDLPPLAPVASSEDECVGSSDESEPAKRRTHSKTEASEQYFSSERIEEYAIDFSIPPLLPKLAQCTKERNKGRTRRKPLRWNNANYNNF